MAKLTWVIAVLAACMSAAGETVPTENLLAWPQVAASDGFDLAAATGKRVGFTLAPEAQGRRVVVAIKAFRLADESVGYSQDLAFDVNGEVMGLNIADQPRLLNRPMEFRFAPGGSRTTVSGRAGVLGLIENHGSARWTLPATSSFDVWLRSESYKPADLPDPQWLVLEVTDLVHIDAYNYVNVKNESSNDGTLRIERVSVHVEPSGAEAIDAVSRKLYEQYFGREAVRREPVDGREWAYEMDLIDNAYGSQPTMADIQNIEDARRIIEPLKRDGYTAVMVSGLHMRYTYTDWWETRIIPYMKYICRAAHEAGMKVIDHYDVPIFYSRGYPFLLEDDHLEWTQRDIRYGTPTRMYCINNPHFREHFFAFTRRVQRESVIDGYQIDEVNFFDRSFCGCEHCRDQFEEETGYSLPREADSPTFFNNSDPLWRLFLLWRRASQVRFKRDFLASIHQVNPAAFLSTYTTSHYSANRRGGAWGSFIISYANGKEGVTRLPMHDHLYGLADLRIYTGVADALDHSSWMLWYPLTGSAARFCWAMSQFGGTAQWHARRFSSSVRDLIQWPHKMSKLDFTNFSDVGMLFSEKSKDASMWTGYYHGMEHLGWGEAMVGHNLQYKMLHEVAVTPELLSRYKVIILPQMTLIDEPCRKAIETYVREGGTLVVTGETGMLDERGRPRPDFLLGELMNVRFVEMLHAPFDVAHRDETFTYAPDRMFYQYGARMLHVAIRDPKHSRVLVQFHKNGEAYSGVIESEYGKGKVYTVAAYFGVSNFQLGLREGSKPIFKTNPDSAPFMTRLLRDILAKGETVVGVDVPDTLLYSTFIDKQTRSRINIHFLNVADYRPLAPDEAGRRRNIAFLLVEDDITLLLRGREVTGAVFRSPDASDEVACTVDNTAEGARVTIPGGSMKMYGLLDLQTVGGGP